jgi:glucose-1-phosphate cytidylyltransferase
MKAVILAGGLGERMGDMTTAQPKPMLKVGDRPLLWHLMQLCAAQGSSEFLVALGYKGMEIKDYFVRYGPLERDVSLDLDKGTAVFHEASAPDWQIHLIDTGTFTMTGGRLKRLRRWLDAEPYFLMTYGDGLADVDLRALERFHIGHGRLATMTAVRVPERFGRLSLDGDRVTAFQEKPDADRPWINAGFFLLSPKVLDYIDNDATVFEREPLERLCAEDQLRAFSHDGFWSCVDMPRDLAFLETAWRSGRPPWQVESWSDGASGDSHDR